MPTAVTRVRPVLFEPPAAAGHRRRIDHRCVPALEAGRRWSPAAVIGTGPGLAEATSVDVVARVRRSRRPSTAGRAGVRLASTSCSPRCRRSGAGTDLTASGSAPVDEADPRDAARRVGRADGGRRSARDHPPARPSATAPARTGRGPPTCLACIAAEPGRRAPDFAERVRARGAAASSVTSAS